MLGAWVESVEDGLGDGGQVGDLLRSGRVDDERAHRLDVPGAASSTASVPASISRAPALLRPNIADPDAAMAGSQRLAATLAQRVSAPTASLFACRASNAGLVAPAR